MGEGHDTRSPIQRHRNIQIEGRNLSFHNLGGAAHQAGCKIVLFSDEGKQEFLQDLFSIPDQSDKHQWLSYKQSEALLQSLLDTGCGGFLDLLTPFEHVDINPHRWPSHQRKGGKLVPRFTRVFAKHWDVIKKSGAGRAQMLDLFIAAHKMRDLMKEDEEEENTKSAITCLKCGYTRPVSSNPNPCPHCNSPNINPTLP